ncbi:Ribosomal large subunit pseudouridine synthase B [Porphyridium purpureum]|uniref:Ribosomal large subunit pseudouridine synthase B n=1 Tax=Porphyridium purpureum TaxID=35688 RepID=A0A5J4YJ30_PORPP|nr:Ribosomal large subunit pseudouridine synthase B [Porphyridium purpureum]|eukprot:POR5762..scf251_18
MAACAAWMCVCAAAPSSLPCSREMVCVTRSSREPSAQPPRRSWSRAQRAHRKALVHIVEARLLVSFHKPKGLVCTHRDELRRETVYAHFERALVERYGIRGSESSALRNSVKHGAHRHMWHTLGRLDLDTTGLLLFTNYAPWVLQATDPSAHAAVQKRYFVHAAGQLGIAELEALRNGVQMSGGLGISAPATVTVLATRGKNTDLEIGIRQGKNRQVRRMLLAVGSQALRLHRVAFGDIELGSLPEGCVRLEDPAQLSLR